jgi:glycosyltransferase involved in cell wall biosynthesis
MQQTDFPFVAIVHDDASTDGSATIIREYEQKYPHIFKPIYEIENQYSKKDGTLDRIMNVAIEATGAKYVAMCEGDDYWTDPLKLQKQVDFMESNLDYSLCFTNSIVKSSDHEAKAINYLWDTYTVEEVIETNSLNMMKRGDNVVSCGHTSTVLYRRPQEKMPKWISQCFIGDEPLFIYLAQYGKAKFLNEMMSVYRAGVGVSSRNFDQKQDWLNRIDMYKIINKGLGYKYHKIIKSLISQYYFDIAKLLSKTGHQLQAIPYMFNSFTTDYNIIINSIKTKI